jgi:hypothetical protein
MQQIHYPTFPIIFIHYCRITSYVMPIWLFLSIFLTQKLQYTKMWIIMKRTSIIQSKQNKYMNII